MSFYGTAGRGTMHSDTAILCGKSVRINATPRSITFGTGWVADQGIWSDREFPRGFFSKSHGISCILNHSPPPAPSK